ncbi:hypothetical protein MB02_12480 [Croceicoccus estronivorus]|nr:hypothetical protein MB02_12480 [Croceicoccus estronivorus]
MEQVFTAEAQQAAVSEFSNLVQLLTASLLGEEEPWRAFLFALAKHVNARHATLILTPPNDSKLGTNITPTVAPQKAREYIDRFLQIDPFVNLPEGKVVMMYEYVGPGELERASAYKEWLESVDGSHIMGVDLKISSGFDARLRLTRWPGSGVFNREERNRIEALLPHLRQTLELYQRLATTRSEYSVLIDTVAQFSVGTVLLDHDLNVIRLNEVAAAILAEADGIRLVGQSVVVDGSARNRKFRAMAKAMADKRSEQRIVMGIERPSGRRELALVMKPVTLPDFMQTGQAPAVALFLTDPSRQRMVRPDVVRKIFALTPTEAAIAAALANGLSVVDTAAMLSIARSTVRAHLRSIFSKLGLNRQSQLIHLIHTSVPETFGIGEQAADGASL